MVSGSPISRVRGSTVAGAQSGLTALSGMKVCGRANTIFSLAGLKLAFEPGAYLTASGNGLCLSFWLNEGRLTILKP